MDICFDYNLNRESIVFDVGGYQGEFTQWLRSRYGCGVHVFEPYSKFFKEIVQKFENDPLVWPYNVGLEDKNEEKLLNLRDNSTSFYIEPKEEEVFFQEEVQVRDIQQFIEDFRLPHIDLLKMNCEGSEYPILDKLIDTGYIKNVKQIVVQFHDLNGKNKTDYHKKLEATHDVKHRDDHWEWLVLK